MLGGLVGIGGDPRINRVSVVATRSKRMTTSVIRATPIGIHVLGVRGPSNTSYKTLAAAETPASSEITNCQCFAPNCRNDSLFIGVSKVLCGLLFTCFYFNGSWSKMAARSKKRRERKSFSEILIGGLPRDL